jgi:phospholipid/cholesterol/gamma-HCH transport system permease protein
MTGRDSRDAATIAQAEGNVIALGGNWTAYDIAPLEKRVQNVSGAPAGLVIDGSAVEALDMAGGRLIQRLLERLRGEGIEAQLRGFSPAHQKLLDLGEKPPVRDAVVPPRYPALDGLGRRVFTAWHQGLAGLSFVGETAHTLVRCLAKPARLRVRPILYNIQGAGTAALPIVGLLAFMLGIVVAYQGADQLMRYGANIFVVDLVGISMVREFAPLVTAIIVAGRSGSAYAAQIGAMKTSEEIDAMRTLGIPPLEMLVLPKLIALVIVLPLLTVFADAAGIVGGMMMASSRLGVGYHDFIERLGTAVAPTSFMVGIIKAPVFAAIIAITGCFQGFRAEGGADSVGSQTTRAVVQSIFMVILVDALFSVLFSRLDL